MTLNPTSGEEAPTPVERPTTGPRLDGRAKTQICVAGLALLPYVVFYQITTLQAIPTQGDILDYYYPVQYLINQQLRQGTLPLWNSGIFGGIPLLASSGSLYPLNLLFALVPAWITITYTPLLHYSLAGVFMFVYARALGMSRKAALVAGIVYMLCGFSISHIGHHNIHRTVPWLPLILWSVERWRKRFELKYIGAGALATGFMLLGGHPQIPIYSLAVVGAYVLFLSLFPREPGNRWRFALGGAAIIALGLLIAAPLLWDLYELSQSFRLPRPAASQYEYFTSFSLPPMGLLTLIAPRLYVPEVHPTEMAGYVGILPLVLALLAAFRWKHRAKVFYLLVAAVSFVLILGKYTPLYQLMYHVPIYNSFRIPARNWFELDFALAVLAGAGVHLLFSAQAATSEQMSRWARGLAIGLILVGILFVTVVVPVRYGTIGATPLGDYITRAAVPPVYQPLFMIAASVAVLVVIVTQRWQRYAVALLTGLIILDLAFSFAIPHVSSMSEQLPPSKLFAETFEQQPGAIEFLRQDPSAYRMLTYSPLIKLGAQERYGVMIPNLHLLFDLESADGYLGDSIPTQYSAFTNSTIRAGFGGAFIHPSLFLPEYEKVLDLLNVKYILIPEDHIQPLFMAETVDGIALDVSPLPGLDLMPTGLVSATLDARGTPATTIAIASTLVGHAELEDGEPVARITVTDETGWTTTRYLLAGQHTAEMTYDCAPGAVHHEKPKVAFALPGDPACASNVYFARLELAEAPAPIQRIEIVPLQPKGHLHVRRLSLYDAQSATSSAVSVALGNLAYLSRSDHYQQVYEDRQVRIYENLSALPRAFLVPRVEQVQSSQEAYQIVHSGLLPDGTFFDPTEVALVEASIPLPRPGSGEDDGVGILESGPRIELVPGNGNQIVLQAWTEQAAFLVYSQGYYPGWEVRVDGQPATIYRTNGALMGIPLSPGQHQIVLDYRPASLFLLFSSIFFALAIGAGLAFGAVRALLRKASIPG